MSTAPITQSISVEDYLAGELSATIKHEYVAGSVFAMVEARNAHNVIASNVLGLLGAQLRGKPCQAFNSDTKIRVQTSSSVRFYYPDVSVVCEPNPLTDTFQDQPVVVVEVLSESTRRLDDGEKRDAYLTLPSLAHYVLFEQDSVGAVLYEPSDKEFTRREFTNLDDVIPLPAIGAELALRDVYENALPSSTNKDN